MSFKQKIFQLSKKQFLLIWIAFHLSILIFVSIKFFISGNRFSIDADLFNITPKTTNSASISKSEEKLTSTTGNNAFILVSNSDFDEAKKIASIVYEQLQSSDYFSSVNLYNNLDNYSEIQDFIFKYRWNLLDEESIDLINSADGKNIFATNAISKAFSPFTISSLEKLDEDPFLISEIALQNYLNALQKSGTAMTLKDGMLVSQNSDRWYIMIRCVLNNKGRAMATKNNGVNEIYKICCPLENSDTKFIFSGTPFHSNDSSLSASKEITLISILSLGAVLFLLLIVFKTPLPIVYSFASITISVLFAFLTTMAVFNQVMILTLVFGTSLIGSCIDYSLHYFTQWSGNNQLKSSVEIRNYLLRGLTMALLSSVLCYGILLFAPFKLLKQISLFSLVGLTSSYLTTICIYPMSPLPKGNRILKIPYLYNSKTISKSHSKKIHLIKSITVASLFAVSVATIFINRNFIGIENDISKLYTMKGRLLENEIEAAKIIQYSPTGWFIISGETENQVLLNEEIFRKKLEEATKKSGGYLSPSLFIPSVEKQKKSKEAVSKLLSISDKQFALLGLDENLKENFINSFNASENDYITFDENLIPKTLFDSLSSVYIGKIDGKFYTALVPNLTMDSDFFDSLCSDNENVFFISKKNDISKSLDKLTKMVLIFFGVSYVVMFILLKLFYSWKQTIKIISVPLIITTATSAVFALTKTKLEFFSVTGLILVFGLGLDYIIYIIENEKKNHSAENRLEPFATALSFATTLISFGALALSSFKPVHLIGLSITIGLTTAFICSRCFESRKN